MKTQIASLGLLVPAVALVVGCGDSITNNYLCAEGTVLDGKKCVAMSEATAGASSGGEATGGKTTRLTTSQGGAKTDTHTTATSNSENGGMTATGGATAVGGSGSMGGTTSTGGANATSSTLSLGGATAIGGSGSTGGTTATGGTTSVGGASSTGGATAAGASGIAESQWMLIRADSLLLYDRKTFPNTPPYTLSPSYGYLGESSWSPDRRKVLYSDGGYKIRELTPNGPSQPWSLGYIYVPEGTGRKSAWSPDSQSLVVTSVNGFGVVEPSQSLPVVRRLSVGFSSFSWAPVGNKLFYVAGTESYAVEVTAGVPGTPVRINQAKPTSWVWSPKGDALVTCTDGLVDYTAFGTSGPSTTRLYTATGTYLSCGSLGFNNDGTRLTFMATQSGVAASLFWSSIAANVPSTPVEFLPPSTPWNWSSITEWSKVGSYLRALNTTSNTDLFINFSGTTPSAVSGPSTVYRSLEVWSPYAPQVCYFEQTPRTVACFDCLTPASGAFALTTGSVSVAYGFKFAPQSTTLAYALGGVFYLYDTANKGSAPVPYALGSTSDTITKVDWSSDAAYLGVVLTDSTYSATQNRATVMRVQGVSASANITPWVATSTSTDFSFQP